MGVCLSQEVWPCADWNRYGIYDWFSQDEKSQMSNVHNLMLIIIIYVSMSCKNMKQASW